MSPGAFDIDEPQALLFDPDNPDGDWLHLVLLRRIQGAEWVCLKPDFSLEIFDLQSRRVHALRRRGPFPRSTDGYVIEFEEALADDELAQQHAQATALANLMTANATTESALPRAGLSWRVSHTGSEYFGEAVDDAVVSASSTGVVRGAIGLAHVHDQWLHVERVPDAELASWLTYIRNGPGRDSRLAGSVRDAGGRSFVSLHEYLGMLRPVDRSKDPSWPHRGPSAAVEVLQGVRGSGKELIQYDDHWTGQSGINPKSSIRSEHKTLFHALALFQSVDQIDLPATAGGEFIARRVVQIQRAVKANPAAPNFAGLHQMTAHTLDETGGLAVQAFTQHFATIAEAEARVLKQNRLLRSEMTARGAAGAGAAEDTDDEEEPQASGAARRRRRPKATPKPAVAGPKVSLKLR